MIRRAVGHSEHCAQLFSIYWSRCEDRDRVEKRVGREASEASRQDFWEKKQISFQFPVVRAQPPLEVHSDNGEAMFWDTFW